MLGALAWQAPGWNTRFQPNHCYFVRGVLPRSIFPSFVRGTLPRYELLRPEQAVPRLSFFRPRHIAEVRASSAGTGGSPPILLSFVRGTMPRYERLRPEQAVPRLFFILSSEAFCRVDDLCHVGCARMAGPTGTGGSGRTIALSSKAHCRGSTLHSIVRGRRPRYFHPRPIFLLAAFSPSPFMFPSELCRPRSRCDPAEVCLPPEIKV